MYVYTGRGRGSRSRSRGDDRLRPVPARTIQCRVDGVDALTPILRERGVVDDDLEVALGVLLVAEGVLDLRDRRVGARRASCANTAMVQVCAEKYYPYVECLYEAAAIHASDGDLVCTELDCAAALGAATSDAVAARPAALVAFTCAALVLYWAAVPIAR